MRAGTHPASLLAPWRWRDGLWGLLLGAGASLALWTLQPQLLQFWHAVVNLWSQPLGLAMALKPLTQEAPPPSVTLLLTTSALVALLYAVAGQWHERYQPLRVVVRALCLVQGSACLFFALVPARFPYGVHQHLTGLLQMGADFLMTVPLMLALGWGVLHLPWRLKLLGPLLVLAYFALWLPHQVLLHAWVLQHGSVLFMPVLLLCLGPLLNGWIFVALYAWLASLTPRVANRPPQAFEAARQEA